MGCPAERISGTMLGQYRLPISLTNCPLLLLINGVGRWCGQIYTFNTHSYKVSKICPTHDFWTT